MNLFSIYCYDGDFLVAWGRNFYLEISEISYNKSGMTSGNFLKVFHIIFLHFSQIQKKSKYFCEINFITE